MSFATPLGLLALLAVPAVLALHLFRRRRPPRRVAGLFLWAPDAQAAAAGARRDRLQRTASLWLELAAAILLGLWLGGLTIGTRARPPHLVVVLDDSASMAAEAGGVPVVERVREAVLAEAAALPDAAVVTVIRTGPRPEVSLGPRAPRAQLADALVRYRPRQPGHDAGPALDLGRQLVEGDDPLLFVTDHPQQGDHVQGYDVVALGTAAGNAALASVRRLGASGDPQREQVFVDVRGFARSELGTTVQLLRPEDGSVLAQQDVALPPGQTVHLSLSMPRTAEPIEVALGPDPLALDNRALLLPEPQRVVTVADLLAEDVSAALRTAAVLAVLPGVRAVSDPRAAALVLSPAPGALRAFATELVVAPVGEERDAWVGPFLLERRHPVLQGITLDGVVWSAGRGQPDGLPLVLADRQALLTELEQAGGHRLHLNLDPLRTNLTASPDWPILMANVCDAVRARLSGPAEVNTRVGGLLEYRHAGSAEDARLLELVDPDGRRLPARGQRMLTWEAPIAGLYRLLHADVPQEVARFAVHFVDAAESDLTDCATARTEAGARAPSLREGEDRERSDAARTTLALLLLAVALLDWFVLARGSA